MGKDGGPKRVDETTSHKVYKMTQEIFTSSKSLESSYALLRSLKERIKDPSLSGDASGPVSALFEEVNKRYLGDKDKRSKFEENLNYALLTLADKLSEKMVGRVALKNTKKLTNQLIQKLPIDFQAEGFNNMLHMFLWQRNDEAKALTVLNREGAKDLISRENIEGATPLHYAIHFYAVDTVDKMLSMLSHEEFKNLPRLDLALKNLFTNVLEVSVSENPESQNEYECAMSIMQLVENKVGDDPELKALLEKIVSDLEAGTL